MSVSLLGLGLTFNTVLGAVGKLCHSFIGVLVPLPPPPLVMLNQFVDDFKIGTEVKKYQKVLFVKSAT